MQANLPSKEQWKAWVRDPITQRFLTDVQEERERGKEQLAQDKAGDLTEKVIGGCLALQWVLDYAVRDFEFEGKGEQNGFEGPGIQNPSED